MPSDLGNIRKTEQKRGADSWDWEANQQEKVEGQCQTLAHVSG